MDATYGLVGAHTMTGQQLATQVSVNVVVAVFLHGARRARLVRAVTGERVCLAVTLLDGDYVMEFTRVKKAPSEA